MTGIPMAAPAAPRPVQQAAAPVAAPPAPVYAPPVAVAPEPAPSLPPPPPMQWQAPPEKKIPNWLGFLIAAAVFGGIAYSVIWYTGRDETGSAKKAAAGAVAPKSNTKHPYANALEVAGFRITQPGKNKVSVQFLVVNHSGVEMSDLGGVITLRAKGLDAEAAPAAVFQFKVSSVPPFGAKEVEVSEVMEIRKPNDMPDWQFYEPVVEITSPVE
jgi:hypothetical protein